MTGLGFRDREEWQLTFREVRTERQGGYWHVFYGLGIEAEDTEIMNGVAVHWVRVGFFMIVKDNVAREGPSANDMSICDD
jgi:hypothetical protein